MFFNAEDDEQDFMSTGGSKLANLFGLDKASGQGGNASLTYTAPKQPKKKEASPEGGAVPAVIIASIVHAYKYVDNKYASQGKLGAALLLTQATKDYRILLYVNKQQQITSAKITPAFSFSIQQNNYATFYDDARQMWSIMFDTSEAAEKFAKEMALARAGSGALSDLVQQDLSLGEGGSLESGDSAEVKYTGWLLTGGTFGKVFDQSAADSFFRFKVGKGKVIKGWDQGMLGMKKGGKRLLVIPPSLAYGSQGVGDRIPPNSALIFEVQVVRVKLQKGESSQDSPDPPPLPVMTEMLDQDELDGSGVKDRSRSISEHLSHSPDTNKAKLISRMAKMGQPMLPFQGAVAAQPDDSDEELHHQMQQTASMKPALPTKPRSSSGVGLPAGQVIISQAQSVGMNPSMTMSASHPVLTSAADMMQQQPAFLQNFPGAQQMAVYQTPNTFLQQQQQALLQQHQQQQQLIQQQQQQIIQQQQQQQLLGQGMPPSLGGLPGQMSAFGVTAPAQPSQQHSSSSADALAPVLLTETRQQNTEVRIGISKMADKVDKILEKVDHLSAAGLGGHAMGMITPYGGNFQAPSMEANVLMQNISRIVQENERLKKEVYEQSNKVQEQNDKIGSLLDKNQKYVEQSQNLLEQRNEGYKMTASQSQARVLSLEQEKVHLATELSSSSAQITILQLELGEYRKREGELKQQLQSTSSLSSSSREELDRLRIQREEDEQKINSLNASVRDEKLARKAMETKLASHQEEFTEIKAAKETLEKTLSERKRKAAEERRKLEEDLEDTKINCETTIEDLREKLRKQKTSVDVDTQSKMSKIEDEISQEWQAKSDRMLAAASEKYSRQLADLTDEKEELMRQVGDLEKKLVVVRSSGSSTEQQVTQLQDELTEMKLWKEKYDNLRTQAATMKDRYEKRIGELEGEKEEEGERRNEVAENSREQNQELQQKVQQLQQEVQQLHVQLSATRADLQRNASPAPSTSGADVSTEVKKIMNSVFQSLRSEFDAEDNYQGSQVLATILNVIKQTTLKLVSQPATRQESLEPEEEDEDQDEETEEEDQDEEEEHDKEDEVKEQTKVEENEAEDEVDEPGGSEIPISKEEALSFSVVPTTDEKISALLPASEESSKKSHAEEKRITEPADVNISSPPTASGSDEDYITVNENLPSLDSNIKGHNVAKEVAKTAEKYVSPEAAEDHSADNAEAHDQNQLNTSNQDEIFNESVKETLVDSFQQNPETTNVSQISPDKNVSQISPDKNVSQISPDKNVSQISPDKNVSQISPDKNVSQISPDKNVSQISLDKNETLQSCALSSSTAAGDGNVTNGDERSVGKSESATDRKGVEPAQKVLIEASLNVAPKLISDSREPPPLFDDDDDDDDSPLFGSDNTVSDTLGSAIKPKLQKVTDVKPASKSASPAVKNKTTPGKKLDLANDEDLKPQPPPPLFGDDSDEDDFGWLS